MNPSSHFLQPNFSGQVRQERSLWALIRVFAGMMLITAAIALAFHQRARSSRKNHPRPTSHSTIAPAFSTSAAKSPSVGPRQLASSSDELALTLEEFQARYESISGKTGDQEAFFQSVVGKKVVWTVKVDHVFRVENGVIVVFSSIDRPDWSAFPISDARFPVQFESRLMTLPRGEIIKLEGRIVYQGIKTLECSNFQVISSDAQDHAK